MAVLTFIRTNAENIPKTTGLLWRILLVESQDVVGARTTITAPKGI